jgi:hypothetical protein
MALLAMLVLVGMDMLVVVPLLQVMQWEDIHFSHMVMVAEEEIVEMVEMEAHQVVRLLVVMAVLVIHLQFLEHQPVMAVVAAVAGSGYL